MGKLRLCSRKNLYINKILGKTNYSKRRNKLSREAACPEGAKNNFIPQDTAFSPLFIEFQPLFS